MIELGGETPTELVNDFKTEQRATVKVGQVGKLLKELKSFDAGYAVMVGQVTPGKLFRGLHPDLKAIRMLAGLDRKNAETIFGAIADEIENAGVHLLDDITINAVVGFAFPGWMRLYREVWCRIG